MISHKLQPVYKRILLKLSGEALMGKEKCGIEHAACVQIAHTIKELCDWGIQVGIVVGAGNLFRGSQAAAFHFSRVPSDHIGMIATAMNGLILQQYFAALGVESPVMSAFKIGALVEEYTLPQVLNAFKKNLPVIFVGGTGHPYFTTDSAAALRASEIQADILLKATKVDGIYSDDPLTNPLAVKYSQLTYSEVLAKKLHVMDATAVVLCRDNAIPICVCNLFETGVVFKAVCGQKVGSLVMGD